MQHEEAKKLRENWGDKPCDHPKLEKEYYLGTHTMDYVCTQCGEDFTAQEKKELEERRNK